MKRVMKLCTALVVLVGVLSVFTLGGKVLAAEDIGGFSLQVTPSPLIATIEPGQTSVQEIKIRNANTVAETLKIEVQGFSVDKNTGEITVGTAQQSEAASFVSFSDPVFTVESGQWFTQRVTINTPKDAGFSYSFALLISREKKAAKKEGVNAIEGSVALFTLLNVDRPDATRELKISSLSSAKKVYEYMPAKFDVTLENVGNTNVQPKGTLFIGRKGDEVVPLAAIDINPGGGYILPSNSRTLKLSWSEGFPRVNDKGERIWDWSRLSNLRIGQYKARVIAIYDDGQRDIPLETTISFWVFPWKLILGALVVALLIGVGTWSTLRGSVGLLAFKKKSTKNSE